MSPTGGTGEGLLLFSVLFLLYSSSFVTGAYRNYTLNDGKMCSTFFNTKTLHIADVEQAISITEHFNQSRWRSFKSFNCNFEVKFKNGIFAVIQSMNLRRSGNGMCLDYIQLNGKKEAPKKFCGTHNVNAAPDSSVVHHLHLDSELADNAYFEPGNELDVHISISHLTEDANLDFHIVFTPVLLCRTQTENVHCDYKKCISKNFHHDRVVNCPYTTCVDEEGCPIRNWEMFPRKGLGTKVTLSAIAVLIVAFLLFLFAIWVLRRCYCQPTRRRTPMQSNAEAGLVMRPVIGATTSSEHPSAPPITSDGDKDPPPSYESLFPAR